MDNGQKRKKGRAKDLAVEEDESEYMEDGEEEDGEEHWQGVGEEYREEDAAEEHDEEEYDAEYATEEEFGVEEGAVTEVVTRRTKIGNVKPKKNEFG